MIGFSFFQVHRFALDGFHFKSVLSLSSVLSGALRYADDEHDDCRERPQEDDNRADVNKSVHIRSSSSVVIAPFFFSSWMFRPRPRISLHKTSKLTGVPASSVFVPFTMLS